MRPTGVTAPAQAPRRTVAALTALLLVFGWLVATAPTATADGPTTFDNTTSIAIPASGSANQMGPASPYPSNITVSGMTGAVTKVTVTFHNLTHGSLGDVDAMVVAPNGANLVVLSDVGDPNQLVTATGIDMTLSDTAAGSVPAQVVVPSGTYRPTNNNPGGATDSFPGAAPSPSTDTTLAEAFTGIDPNGTWRLFVVDDASGDVGTMAGGWSLTVTSEASAVATATTVTSSDATSTTGDPVTFTATVKVGATPVTTGTVQFASDGTNLGSPVTLNASGVAALTTSALAEGTHLIRATFSGATGFLTSNGTVSQRVDNATVVNGKTYCNTGSIVPPDKGMAAPYPSNIFVSALAGQVTNITATLKGLSHTAPIDFDILLSGPTATKNVILLSDTGGQNPVSNLNVTFDDAAATGVPTPLVSGTFKPTNVDPDGQVDTFPAPAPARSGATTLSTFNGASANGTWSLWVVDDATGDTGQIANGWCLTITSQSPTTTALTATPNPSHVGSSVHFAATVTSGGSPVTTGSVQFSDAGANLGAPVPVSASGVATLDTSALTVGTHPIRATYAGTDTLAESHADVSQVVTLIPTTTALTSSLDPSLVGDAVTFGATVTDDAGNPVTGGTIQFADGATNLGSPVSVTAGTATLTTDALASGTHTIKATYSGTATLATSDDDLQQVVNKVVTATDLTSSANPSLVGQSITFTATVTAGATRVDAGQVQFSDGSTPIGGPVNLAGDGTATLTTSTLVAGSHTIKAAYLGTATYAASDDSVDQVVNKTGTSTALTSSLNPSTVGAAVTFTATVTATGGVPATGGSVQFSIDGSAFGAPVLLGGSGIATFTTSALSAGTHEITAAYSGTDALEAGSPATLDQDVELVATTTDLTSSVNPSTFGQSVTFTATVTAGGLPVGGGTVQFARDGIALDAPVTLAADGTATITTSTLTVGTHAITATYLGTDTYAGSNNSLNQTVSLAPTTTVVASDGSPAEFGAPVTFTATVTVGGVPASGGTIQFTEGGAVFGPTQIPVDANGRASVTATSLDVGSHTIVASYSGTDENAASTGSFTQSIVAAATTTTLASDRNPSQVGQPVTFTATVLAGAAPVGEGVVEFLDGGTSLGTEPLAADGTASITTSTLARGSHPITAVYSGTTNYVTSTSASVAQVVAATTTTTLTSAPNPSQFGQTVTFTATVTSDGAAVSEGSVEFREGATVRATVPVAVDGTATYSTGALDIGSHSITAAYTGTATYTGSEATVTQEVGKVVPVASLVVTPEPSTLRENATLTVTLTVPPGIPTVGEGSVQFFVDGAPIGPALPVAGSAELTTADLPVGTLTIRADYTGDGIYADTSATATHVVQPRPTTVAGAGTPNPSTFGDTVTFTATVTNQAGGAPVTTGDVEFLDGTTSLGTSPVGSDGTATLSTADLAAGSHQITMNYLGTAEQAAATTSVTQVVQPADTTITLTALPPASSNFGEPVTFTATVTSANGPVTDGSVAFTVDGTVVEATAALAADGTATFTTSSLSPGAHSILAGYNATANYTTSSDTLDHTVNLVASAGGPYAVAEGDGLTLDGSGSSAGATSYEWDLDGDGTFGDVTGTAPTLTWDDLESFGIDDGPGSYPVALRVTVVTPLGGTTSVDAAATIEVSNTAPKSVLTGSLTATVGTPFTIKVGADDPSSADMAAQFTYTVDWGDGSPVEKVTGPADPPVTHTYTAAGDYDAAFTATDKDGGQGDPTAVQVVAESSSTSNGGGNSDNGSLASTGSSTGAGTVLFGGALLIAGAAMLMVAGRRRFSHGSHE